MKRYIYPAVVYKDKNDDTYTILIPDLDIITVGETIEEAYKNACDHLTTYLKTAVKFDVEIPLASGFFDVADKNTKRIVVLTSTILDNVKPELSDYEKSYKAFLKKLITD